MKTKQYTSYFVLCSFNLNTQVAENLKPEIRYRHTIDFCLCKGKYVLLLSTANFCWI
jgi:hypothetical protein